MSNKKEKMVELRKQGMTYQEIADIFGCSRSYVGSLLGKSEECKFRPLTSKDCIYVGIRNWMNENKVSKSEFCRMIYGYAYPGSIKRYSSIFRGHGCSKHTIDMLLTVTGLTYEEAFKVDGECDG